MGKLLKDLEELNDNGFVGDWCFVEQPNRQIFFLRYPVSDKYVDALKEWWPYEEERGEVVSIPISGSSGLVWNWNGDKEFPTISPSINVVGRWHGFFRNGKIETVE